MTIGIIAGSLVLAAVILIVLVKSGGKTNDIDTDDAKRMLAGEGVFLLDVRSEREYEQFHIPGSTLIPLGELQGRMEDIISRREKPLLVYCHSGMRSRKAARLLKVNGFEQVYNMQGGIKAWMGRGYEVEKGQ